MCDLPHSSEEEKKDEFEAKISQCKADIEASSVKIEDIDDVASTASTTLSSFYSDRSFPSDQASLSSTRSNPSSSSKSSTWSPEVSTGLREDGEQGYPSAASGGLIGAALAAPARRFRHLRTRSTCVDYRADVAQEPEQTIAEASAKASQRRPGAWSASLPTLPASLRRSKIRFASPLVEVAPIEEAEEDLAEVEDQPPVAALTPIHEDLAEFLAVVAEEPMPMAPMVSVLGTNDSSEV